MKQHKITKTSEIIISHANDTFIDEISNENKYKLFSIFFWIKYTWINVFIVYNVISSMEKNRLFHISHTQKKITFSVCHSNSESPSGKKKSIQMANVKKGNALVHSENPICLNEKDGNKERTHKNWKKTKKRKIIIKNRC